MSYKVLIVDDEEIMRGGLANLVDWKSMGFHVVDKLEDGQDAIEYIGSKSVDVILTDIKMTFASGLDVAKYIYENNLPIKVVFLSGYKEFELAQKAISYNVAHYLLKPVMLKDICDVFQQLREQLDKEQETKRLYTEKSSKLDELLLLSRKQFFEDAESGAFRNETDVINRIRILGLNADVAYCKCSILNLRIQEFEHFMNNSWGYSKEGLYNAIRNFFSADNSSIQYYDIGMKAKEMHLIAIEIDKNIISFEQELIRQINEIQLGIKALLGLEISISVQSSYDSILKMALLPQEEASINLVMENRKNESAVDAVKLIDQQKLIYTHILNGETDMAKNLFERYIQSLGGYGTVVLQKSIFDFFEMLTSKLKENKFNIPTDCNSLLNLNEWKNCNNVSEVILIIENIFNNFIKQVDGQIYKKEKDVIVRIKNYISEHYSEDITLEDIAEYVFLSPVYLSRMFKEETGENFSDYMIKIKMEKAMEFLKNPQNKVYDVGHMVGYSSTKYFYKLFKKYKGCTPTEYRNSIF